jgi:hypothetical protein
MDQIEQGIMNTLELKFPKGNSIFCYKKWPNGHFYLTYYSVF